MMADSFTSANQIVRVRIPPGKNCGRDGFDRAIEFCAAMMEWDEYETEAVLLSWNDDESCDYACAEKPVRWGPNAYSGKWLEYVE